MKDYHLKLEPLRYFSTDGDGRTCLKKSGKMSLPSQKKNVKWDSKRHIKLMFFTWKYPIKTHIPLNAELKTS